MWKILVVILTLQLLCGELSGHNIYRGNKVDDINGPYEQQVPVNQHTVYTKEYGRALHDLASFRHKLEQQGLFPNPPFILTNNANDFGYQFLPTYQQQQEPQQHPVATKDTPDCEESKGDYHDSIKHKFIPSINVDNEKKHEVSSHGGDGGVKGAKPAVVVVEHLNSTIHKIGDNIEDKVNAIKGYVEKSVKDINKLGDDVHQQVGKKTSKIFEIIYKKLTKMENQLHDLSDDNIRRIDDVIEAEETKEEKMRKFEAESEEDEDESRMLIEPNVVESHTGQQMKQLDMLDAELRSDFKSSISDAIKRAHDKFNQLIEHQMNRVNMKIGKINEKVEAVVGKLAILKHKPAAVIEDQITTTPEPKPSSTTPDYFKFTVPSNFYHFNEDDAMKRMDTNDDDEEAATVTEYEFRSEESSATTSASIVDDNDLKVSQVLENVKDTLKSNELNVNDDDNDEKKEAEVKAHELEEENPIDDKLKSDNAIESEQQQPIVDIAKTVEEELRSELQMSATTDKSLESELIKVPNQPEIIEDGAEERSNDEDEEDEEEEDETPAVFDEQVKSTDDDDDDNDVDDTETRSIDENSTDNPSSIDEDVASDTTTTTVVVRPVEASSNAFHFDELEIIQLIPIIIEQLRQGHVTESESSSLERIFGNSLWSLIEVEAKRNRDAEEMNPLLKTILNSEEVRLAKRDIQAQIGNDIYKNSLRRVYRGKVPSHGVKKRKSLPRPYISLDDDRKLLSPSERLLNMIAAIVHKSNVMEKERADAEARLREKRKFARRNGQGKKKSSSNLDSSSNLRPANDRKIPLGIAMPRQRYVDRILSTNRMKRSIIKFGTDLADMKALLDQVNHENDSNEDENGENEKQQLASDDFDDYMNDDDYMDDEEDYGQQLSSLVDDEDDYGTTGWSSSYQRNLYDDYEDGSVNEFINLARQRDRREKQFSPPQLRDMDDYLEENDDEEYDDEN